jgi:hypothetical protein
MRSARRASVKSPSESTASRRATAASFAASSASARRAWELRPLTDSRKGDLVPGDHTHVAHGAVGADEQVLQAPDVPGMPQMRRGERRDLLGGVVRDPPLVHELLGGGADLREGGAGDLHVARAGGEGHLRERVLECPVQRMRGLDLRSTRISRGEQVGR